MMKRALSVNRLGGFLETGLAVGTVIVLAAVIAPLMASTKERAADREEMSQLHRLAVAQGIYTGETGAIPTSTLPLVRAGYVPAEACGSPSDRFGNGFANYLTQELGQHSLVYRSLGHPYRSSYLGFREYQFPYKWIDEYVRPSTTGGWLVSLTTSKLNTTDAGEISYSGTYRRLMLDGSAQVRRHQPVSINIGGETVHAEHDLFLFVDGTNEWKRSFISGSR